jgi:2-C-methyl-D-erythritol 4-phosphate cytidylyltransferase/2-C-methyl-D-erythritol 2,4-cyclodiphosphate synthase
MIVNAIIAAGGSSKRYGENKLFEKIGNSNIIMEAVKKFVENDRISRIVIAIKSENVDEMLHFFEYYQVDSQKVKYAQSGDTRSESVQNALISLEDDCDVVLIHDAARPFVSAKLIDEIIDAAAQKGAAVPCVPLVDSIICAHTFPMSQSRDAFRAVQTPQGFDCRKLRQAYELRTKDFADDFGVYETYIGGEVALIQGDAKNIKITTKDDLKTCLSGCGYDIHRLKSGGDGIILGGVVIPYDKSFIAHSDGDVIIHSLMDALLSALGEKDIGHQFPTSDPKYKNASSLKLLDEVLNKVKKRNLYAANISAAVIAEHPRISPFCDQIRQSLARAFGIPKERVGISATTNEAVGEIGKGEAIACYSTVLLTN